MKRWQVDSGNCAYTVKQSDGFQGNRVYMSMYTFTQITVNEVTAPLDSRLLSSQHVDRDQRKAAVMLLGSYQPSEETSTGHLSLAKGNITLHPTLHILRKCYT